MISKTHSPALTGAALGPIFAIALAIMGRQLPATCLPAGSGLFTSALCLGSMIAPFLAAIIVDFWGSKHLFTLGSVLFASVLVRLLLPGRVHRVSNDSGTSQ